MNRNPNWTRQELILALDLYFRLALSNPSSDHPDVVELSQFLNALSIHPSDSKKENFRNPDGVIMKLSNFKSLDPKYEGIGLSAGSKLDEEVWNEFAHDPTLLRETAFAIREIYKDSMISEDVEAVIDEEEKELEIQETEPTVQYNITSYGADYDVEGLVKRLQRGDIVIPGFQRNYVWNLKEASRLIESLLLGLPVPGIFLAREPGTNKLLVIDGQQRLKSLQFFVEGFFKPEEDSTSRNIFFLTGVQTNFSKLTYKDLNDSDRRRFNDSLIHATIIQQDSPENDDTSIYHIFDRLNSSGRKLTPQEIRTAVFHGEFIDLIKRLNNYEPWRNVFGKKDIRLKDQELILRFFALFYEWENYASPINEFLNKFAKKNRKGKVKFYEKSEDIFKRTIDVIEGSLGKKAFRPTRAINAAAYDSMMIGVAKRLSVNPDVDYDKVKLIHEELLQDFYFSTLISQSTSVESNVKNRIELAINAFADA